MATTAILGLLVCAAAISSQSYWLDEAGTAYKAAMPDVRDCWRNVIEVEGGSTIQQPLYMAFIWAWEKLFGMRELALRMANAPWLLLGLIVWAGAFADRPLLGWGMVLAVLVSGFVWYYLNEVRPYAIQIGPSLAVVAALYRLGFGSAEQSSERRWVWVLCVASVLLAASFMLGMLFLGAFLAGAVLSTPWQRLRRLAVVHARLWIWTGVCLFGIGVYYTWTVLIGSRATTVGTTNLAIFFFIPYELLGFSGLGPGRLEIRGGGLSVFKPWLPLLAIHAVLLAMVFAIGVRQLWILTTRRTRISWGLALAAVAGFILAVGIAVRFRVLGRHCATLLPIFVLPIGFGLAALFERGAAWRRWVAAGYLVLSLLSCLSLRFASRHAKDDYRSAASMARDALARGEVVWWSAYNQGAGAYSLPLDEEAMKGTKAPDLRRAMFVQNPRAGFEAALPRPDLVLASKPDVYDCNGSLSEFLRKSGYQVVSNMVAFTAWRPINR
jgi:hypothetical protein